MQTSPSIEPPRPSSIGPQTTPGYRAIRLRSSSRSVRRFDGVDPDGRPVVIEIRRSPLELAEDARRLMQYDVPGLVPIRHVGTKEKSWYVITEPWSGPSFAELAPRDPVLPEDVVALLDPLAFALDHLHALGATHHAFSVQSIVLASAERAALWITGAPSGPLLVRPEGRAEVLAPEAIDYVPPDLLHAPERPDVYALGVLAFRLLTGALPFPQHDTIAATLVERQLRTPPRLAEIARQPMRPSVEDWARVALASNASSRPESAQALVRSLALAAGVPIGEHAPAVARLVAGGRAVDASATALAMPQVTRPKERDNTVEVWTDDSDVEIDPISVEEPAWRIESAPPPPLTTASSEDLPEQPVSLTHERSPSGTRPRASAPVQAAPRRDEETPRLGMRRATRPRRWVGRMVTACVALVLGAAALLAIADTVR